MNAIQRIQLRASELTESINVLLGTDPEKRAENHDAELRRLTDESTSTGVELRAALATAPGDVETRVSTEDSEHRERRRLRDSFSVSRFFGALMAQRAVDGAESEYRAALKLPEVGEKGTVLPLDVFESERPSVEHRAITPGITAEAQAAPTVPFVFERSALAAIGFRMPMVGPGQANFPTVTTKAPAGSVAKGGAASATAAAFTLASRTPKRIAGAFELRVEDTAVFPDMERALRESIMAAGADALDEQGFNGTNANGQLDGLFRQATDVTRDGTAETFQTGVARFAALVDGQYAYDWSDLRAVIGSATFAYYAGLFQSNGDVSLYDYLRMKMGALQVSNRVPAVASNGQKALLTLNAPMIPLRLPLWLGAEIIVRRPGRGSRSAP